MSPTAIEVVGAALFGIAVAHTFMTKYFEHLAHIQPAHAGVWHLLGEVEVVFGFWAFVLLAFIFFNSGPGSATHYLEGLNFTEPAFVFVIMVVAANRPILELCKIGARGVARFMPVKDAIAFYFVCLSIIPLLGSFITEPAAMTLAAIMLRDNFYTQGISRRLKYATLGVLFVNDLDRWHSHALRRAAGADGRRKVELGHLVHARQLRLEGCGGGDRKCHDRHLHVQERAQRLREARRGQ